MGYPVHSVGLQTVLSGAQQQIRPAHPSARLQMRPVSDPFAAFAPNPQLRATVSAAMAAQRKAQNAQRCLIVAAFEVSNCICLCNSAFIPLLHTWLLGDDSARYIQTNQAEVLDDDL